MEEYLKLMEFYKKSNVKAVYKETGYYYIIISIFAIFILLFTLIVFASEHKNSSMYMAITTTPYCIFIYLTMKFVHKFYIDKYNGNSTNFLNHYKDGWQGHRALLFSEFIKQENLNINLNKINKIIDLELDLKKSTRVKNYSNFITIGAVFLAFYLNLIATNQKVFFLILFIFVSSWFFINSISMLKRDKVFELIELKQFLSWYNQFNEQSKIV